MYFKLLVKFKVVLEGLTGLSIEFETKCWWINYIMSLNKSYALLKSDKCVQYKQTML